MDRGQQPTSTYPRPPPFYRSFTAANVSQIQELRKARDSDTNNVDDAGQLNLQDVPEHLHPLIPPEPPADGIYHSFGNERNAQQALPTLPEGIAQLVPAGLKQADRPAELLRISKYILLHFLDLVGALSVDPKLALPSIDDLRALFFNAHQLMNEYRPHQARETLMMMMKAQLQQKKAELEGVKNMKTKVDRLLAELEEARVETNLLPPQSPPETNDTAASDKEEQMRVWAVLDTIKI